MEEFTVTVTWTLQYDAVKVRQEMFAETGKVPTMEDVEERIKEMALNDFCEVPTPKHFHHEDITLDWEGDTMEWDDEKMGV